jgi:hypothetical protein
LAFYIRKERRVIVVIIYHLISSKGGGGLVPYLLQYAPRDPPPIAVPWETCDPWANGTEYGEKENRMMTIMTWGSFLIAFPSPGVHYVWNR